MSVEKCPRSAGFNFCNLATLTYLLGRTRKDELFGSPACIADVAPTSTSRVSKKVQLITIEIEFLVVNNFAGSAVITVSGRHL